MVRQLEDEIGQPLLIRDGRQLRLTDVGKVVFARGQDAWRDAPADAGGGRPHRAQPRRAHGGHAADGQPALPPVVKRFCERHPAIRLTLEEAGGQRIEQRVAAGELEVGATLLPVAPALGLATRSFGRYPLQVVGPRHAAWAGHGPVPWPRCATRR
jgi:DNA-binding transcriptional LysR family regulator